MEVQGVHFDEQFTIRVFDPEKHKEAKDLEEEAKAFLGSTSDLARIAQRSGRRPARPAAEMAPIAPHRDHAHI